MKYFRAHYIKGNDKIFAAETVAYGEALAYLSGHLDSNELTCVTEISATEALVIGVDV